MLKMHTELGKNEILFSVHRATEQRILHDSYQGELKILDLKLAHILCQYVVAFVFVLFVVLFSLSPPPHPTPCW